VTSRNQCLSFASRRSKKDPGNEVDETPDREIFRMDITGVFLNQNLLFFVYSLDMIHLAYLYKEILRNGY
jgi:hypothetical protein